MPTQIRSSLNYRTGGAKGSTYRDVKPEKLFGRSQPLPKQHKSGEMKPENFKHHLEKLRHFSQASLPGKVVTLPLLAELYAAHFVTLIFVFAVSL